MTELLQQAFAMIKDRPAVEQDAIASIILEELEDEARWQAAFANSQDKLSKLVVQVRQDIKAGRTEPLGFDEL